MKRPNSDNEIRYREYPLSVEDIKTKKWFTRIKEEKQSTILRSIFEDDLPKVARAFAMNKRQMKDFSKKLKKEFSENEYFIIEDLKTKEMIGFLKIESQDKAYVIVRYPATKKTNNEELNRALRNSFRNRVVETINNFAIMAKLKFQASEYRIN